MSRLSLNDWYRYLESQFVSQEEATPAEQEPVAEASQPHTPSVPPQSTAAPVVAPPSAPSAVPEPLTPAEQKRAIVSIRVPHFAEFVPLLRHEMNWQPPQHTELETEPESAPTPSTASEEPPSEGPRLRKRGSRKKRDPEAIVPPDADEVWAKLPQYLRYLAEWTDDSVTRKYYPVRGRDESREELIARLTDPVLTLEETARLLGVCPATVRRYTDRGWLHCFRTEGNQRRFRLSDIVAFLEEQTMRQPRGNRNAHQEETTP